MTNSQHSGNHALILLTPGGILVCLGESDQFLVLLGIGLHRRNFGYITRRSSCHVECGGEEINNLRPWGLRDQGWQQCSVNGSSF